MPWKRNKTAMAQGFPDLEFLPHGRAAWDCTLSAMAYGSRMDLTGRSPDLNAWATRHGLPACRPYSEFGESALVLWHGTSRERAEKIAEYGLFHKKGVWTAKHPKVPHAFCRMRSERFGTEGAVVCLVLDRNELVEGHDFRTEVGDNVVVFQHKLPPDVVQYVLVREEIRFVGSERAPLPQSWRKARFKHASGSWRPVQRSPVRFSESETFTTLDEFVRLCVTRLHDDLGRFCLLEALSVIYSLVEPWNCLKHRDILPFLSDIGLRHRRVGKMRVFLSD